MSALSDLLATQPLSARDASKKAEDRGIRLPAGTIAAYWSGRHGRPSPQTLERLAQVIDIPLAKLQEAAWGTAAPLGDYVPPAEAALLDERQRRAIDELIRSIARFPAIEDLGKRSGISNHTSPSIRAHVEGSQTAYELARRQGAGKSRGQQIRDEQDESSD